jgi:hypothetical protein
MGYKPNGTAGLYGDNFSFEGLVMFAFGAFMLIMAWRGAKKNK